MIDRLANIVGPKGFTVDANEMAPWCRDWRGRYQGRARAMVSPQTTREVASIVAYARANNVALVQEPWEAQRQVLTAIRSSFHSDV